MNCSVDLWFSFNLSSSMLRKRFKIIINGVTKKQNNSIILVLNFTIFLWKFDSPAVDTAVDLLIVRSWSKIIPTIKPSITTLKGIRATTFWNVKATVNVIAWNKVSRHPTHINDMITFVVQIVENVCNIWF